MEKVRGSLTNDTYVPEMGLVGIGNARSIHRGHWRRVIFSL